MFFDPQCIPCILKQAYNSASLFTDSKEIQLGILKSVCARVAEIKPDSAAPWFSTVIQDLIEDRLKISDVYSEIKEKNLKIALSFQPVIEEKISASEHPLIESIKAAIAGNAIDYGANPDFNISKEVHKIGEINLDEPTLHNFVNSVINAKIILYIGDNTEEAVFDIFLIKALGPERVVFAVRSRPVLNDITIKECKQLKIDKLCEVVESGSRIAGTDLTQCNSQFIDLFNSADVVIAKGQGNYETLLDVSRDIFFMFKVKCPAIALRCGQPEGTAALIYKADSKEK